MAVVSCFVHDADSVYRFQTPIFEGVMPEQARATLRITAELVNQLFIRPLSPEIELHLWQKSGSCNFFHTVRQPKVVVHLPSPRSLSTPQNNLKSWRP